MPNTGQYSKHLQVYVTPEMHQFLKLLAERQGGSMNDLVRQAIREHLDVQEDVIGSRSRLGARVMKRLEKMEERLVEQLAYQGQLQLAALLVFLREFDIKKPGTLDRIIELAGDERFSAAVRNRK